MNDTKTPGDKTPAPSTGKTLTLKRPVEQGTVRQSFSHGRSKQVVVEKVKRRVIAPADAAAAPAPSAPAATPAPAPAPQVAEKPVAAPAAVAAETPAAPVAATPAPVKAPEPAKVPEAVKPEEPVKVAQTVETPAPAKAESAAPAAPQAAPAAEPVVAKASEAKAPEPKAPEAKVEAAPAKPAPAAPPRPAAQAPRSNEQAPRAARPQDSGQNRSGSSQSQNRPGSGPQRAGGPAGRPGQPQRPGSQQDRRPGAPAGRAGQRQGGSGVVLRTLTDEERNARASALADARVRAVEEQRMAEERRAAEEEARRRAERERIERAEREAAEARKREEDARRAQEEENKRRAEQEARKRLGTDEAASGTASNTRSTTTAGAPRPAGTANRTAATTESEEERRGPPRRGPANRPVAPVKPTRTPPGAEKQRGRLTVVTALSAGDERQRSVASFRRRTQRMTGKGGQQEQKEKIVREVILPETITIQELANRMSERGVDVIRLLMKQGQMLKITDVIDADTAELIAADMGHTVRRVSESDVEEGLFDALDEPETLQDRPPVVTIMGHVDHGKTSLLDALREANVVSGEAGGITQHIGAYQVTSPLGGKITFIDTPGHAAFTAMRARGAKVTDIVVLVVAADDGVMPQTVEAINHARAAGAPIIVAINKIDKPEAKPERVRTELLQHQVQVESLGGETLEVEISAKKRINLDKLLETISLQAEMIDIEANPDRAAEGTVVEAKLDRGRGPVATVLVQRGTLHVSDIVVAGAEWGRVRALITDTGANTAKAGPSMPVEVLGFNGTPEAGDRLAVVENEARAREITDYRQRQKREKAAARSATIRGSLEQMMNQVKAAGRKEFPLIIKGDVQGSVEAIIGALEKLGNDEVQARIIHSGAGGINESDVTLAETSGAAIIAFNVRANKEAREAADRAGIEIRYYNIIYDLVDDVKKAMSGLLAPITRETMLGNASIRQIFAVSKIGKVAGCLVTDGVVERGQHVRLIRDNVVIHEGKLSTLNRFKDAVNTVHSGQECGMSFENYQDMREGDVIECYRVETVQRSL